MKIGFDAKRIFHNTTGLGNYSRDLVRVLDTFYPSNTYFLYNPKPKKVTRLQLTDSMKEVLPNSFFWKKFSSLWRQRAIIQQIKKDKIDLFHGLSGEIPRGLRKEGIKSVVTIHDLIFMRYPNLYSYFDRKIHLAKFKYAAEQADKIIAISEQTKEDIIYYLKVASSKIEVVYQGCSDVFKQQRTEQEKLALKKKYQLPEKFLLNVGTVEERKNALTIIKAIKNIETFLVIVGKKTKYYQQIKSYIETHNLKDKVLFLEGLTLDELSTLYQLAEIFIYPSIFEGFGIPIIEALYSKTPVITTNTGVFPEAGGPFSRYINPYSVDELEKSICELLAITVSEKEEIVEKGYTFVQRFNDDVIAKSVMEVYEKTR